jgi:putative Holliday junction resolvase
MISSDIASFRQMLAGRGRLAGLDVGTKTIGIALCDERWTIASAAETIARSKFGKDFEKIEAFVAAKGIKGLVIGLPLSLDGADSSRTQSTRAFARNLAPLGLPVLLWDERWSTQAVTRALLEADTSRKRRSQLVDKMAAAYILQGAIDALTME